MTVTSSLGAFAPSSGGTAELLRMSPRGRADAAAPVVRRPPSELRLPCMLYAAVGAIPFREGRISPENLERARQTPGVVHVLPLTDVAGIAPAVAVVARSRALARQVVDGLLAEWYRNCYGKAAASIVSAGTVQAIEPCTVQSIDGRLRVWAPAASDPAGMSQLRQRVARLGGLDAGRIEVNPTTEGAVGDLALAPLIAIARKLEPAPIQLLAIDPSLELCALPVGEITATEEPLADMAAA